MGAVSYLATIGIASGALLTLYRNDSLLALARKAGAEASYLKLESSVLGSPGWGTPRSSEELVEASKRGIDQALFARRDRLLSGRSGSPAPVPTTAAPVAPAAAAPAAPAEAPARAASDTASGAVSLESLPVAAAEPEARPEPEATALAGPAPAKVTRTVAASAPRRAAADEDDEPPRKKAKLKKPEPEAAPAPRPKHENPLKAAIRSAILNGK